MHPSCLALRELAWTALMEQPRQVVHLPLQLRDEFLDRYTKRHMDTALEEVRHWVQLFTRRGQLPFRCAICHHVQRWEPCTRMSCRVYVMLCDAHIPLDIWHAWAAQ